MDAREWSPEGAVKKEVKEFRDQTVKMVTGRMTGDEFRQFRLERGVYGQRQLGVQMLRIKIPYGGITPSQLKTVAQISMQHGHGIAHLTTRQDIQLHYINLSDIPSIMERLAESDVTTREACGNTVRNVTACPFAGVCRDELFDVTPHAHRTAQHLMRNASTEGLGRKFKVTFSGCESLCGLTAIHDIGLIAAERDVDGRRERGFKVYVGGGLGAAPKAAQLLNDFVPEDELLPLCEAITRVFFLHGERDRRMKARMKFLVEDIGVDAFRELVNAELRGLPARIPIEPLEVPRTIVPAHRTADQNLNVDPRWRETNVYAQKQQGYVAVTVRLNLGDIEAPRLLQMAETVAGFTDDIRITVDQNFLLRWIPEHRLSELYQSLHALELVEPGASRLTDITVCPGADTCNLGITSSKGLGREFTGLLEATLRRFADHDIKIKISGCPNSCGQHHIADIGFYGCSIRINGRVAPAFQMMLGGHLAGGQAEFAQPIMKVVSQKLPDVLAALLTEYEEGRQEGEQFYEYVRRSGLTAIRARLELVAKVIDASDPAVFRDWGGHSNFALNVKEGECAGVRVDFADALFARANANLAESKQLIQEGAYGQGSYTAYSGIIHAAKAYLASQGINAISYHQIISECERLLSANGNGLSGFKNRIWDYKLETPDAQTAQDYRAFAQTAISWLNEHTQGARLQSADDDL